MRLQILSICIMWRASETVSTYARKLHQPLLTMFSAWKTIADDSTQDSDQCKHRTFQYNWRLWLFISIDSPYTNGWGTDRWTRVNNPTSKKGVRWYQSNFTSYTLCKQLLADISILRSFWVYGRRSTWKTQQQTLQVTGVRLSWTAALFLEVLAGVVLIAVFTRLMQDPVRL